MINMAIKGECLSRRLIMVIFCTLESFVRRNLLYSYFMS
jgi:hypothetical protein